MGGKTYSKYRFHPRVRLACSHTRAPSILVLGDSDERGGACHHILILRGLEKTIVCCGQLPFNLGFDTNHCAVFADIKTTALLTLQMEEPADCSGRRLSSKNSKNRSKYVEHVYKHLKEHNVFQRVANLGQIFVKVSLIFVECWSNVGQMFVKCWSNVGQSLSNVGQMLVKC